MLRTVYKQFWFYFFFAVSYVFFLPFVEEYKLNLVWAPKKKKPYSKSGSKSWRSALPHVSFTEIPRSKRFYWFLYLKVVWDLSRCAIWSHLTYINPYSWAQILSHCLLPRSCPVLQKPPALPSAQLGGFGEGSGMLAGRNNYQFAFGGGNYSKLLTLIK